MEPKGREMVTKSKCRMGRDSRMHRGFRGDGFHPAPAIQGNGFDLSWPSRRASSCSERLSVWLNGQPIEVTLALFGIATAAWTFIATRHILLEILCGLPVLVAARYRDFRLGAVAVPVTAVTAMVATHQSSLEMEVWYGLVLTALLTAVYFLAEACTAWPKATEDAVAAYLSRNANRVTTDVSVVVECDGLEGLDARYGLGSRDHALVLLRRALEEATSNRDMVVRNSEDGFVVMLPKADAAYAYEMLARAQVLFERATENAGYDCAIAFGYEPVEEEQGLVSDVFDTSAGEIHVTEPQPYGAYLN